MHSVYTTPAIVIGGGSYGEADRLVEIYTKRFGLISAIAKSARREVSKMRYGLNLWSFSEVALVRGREFWRLVSVVPDTAFHNNLERLKMVGTLLKRFSGDEIPAGDLFDSVKQYCQYVDTTTSDRLLEDAYIGITLHILDRLGYLERVEYLREFLEGSFDPQKLACIEGKSKEITSLINQALHHSHL